MKTPFLRSAILPVVGLAVGAVLLSYNAVRFSLPMGYAGLYAQASGQIAQANFLLPTLIHYYGPGDIPFAYPPLALYAMAAAIKLGVSPMTYMRFMPPLLSWLALIPVYLLAERATHSRWAAVAALGICAASPALIAAHTPASGIVRALGFLFLLCGLYFFEAAVERDQVRLSVLAGVLLGLVTLTHLFYALFFALWAVCWIITRPGLRSIKVGALVVLVAALVVAPWVLLVIYRDGLAPFANAFLTHGNTSFLDALSGRQDLIAWVAGKLDVVTTVPLLIILVVLGLVGSAAAGEFGMPLVFLAALVVLSPEGACFMIVLAAILAGVGASSVAKWLPNLRWAGAASLILLGLIVGEAVVVGFRYVERIRPDLRDGAPAVGQYIQKNTPTSASYLLMAGPNEAEWFPYLLQRRPLASKWGAEWLGTYDDQSNLVSSINSCHRAQDLGCIRNMHLPMATTDILVTLKGDKELSGEIERQASCPETAAIGQYIVWKAGCLVSTP